MSKFFVTTPIYYVNDAPHIGHAYTTILADVLSRYHRTVGDDVFFLTGLDEHGQKVKQAAEKRGLSPQAHADDLAPRFLNLWKTLDIQYDDFIRTTQERHKKIVQLVLQKVNDNGDIYTDEYEGWYSIAEERFITDAEYESGQFRDVKKIKEKNYFFKMGKYQQRLIDYIQAHPDFIRPEHRKNEMLGFLRQPLGDLCISRPKSRMDWGIEIPFDQEYVTYVWFDALVNYISVPGYGSDEQKFKKWWPADVHLIGKDILTTHCVYWTTMLFSLGLELPKTIFAHGWWLIGETKMSKSLGNVVNPLDLIQNYGVDAVRFYLMREMVLGLDANFTPESFIKCYNSDLANDFGNLLNRVSGLIQKNHDGKIPEPGVLTAVEENIKKEANFLPDEVKHLINEYKVQVAVAHVLGFVADLNKYMEIQAPWKLAKTDMKAANRVLYTAAEGLRIATILLAPVMPEKTAEVLDILGAENTQPIWGQIKPGTVLRVHPPLFPRIEVEKILMSIETIKWVNGSARIIDQTKLPNKFEYIYCRDVDRMWHAIKRLEVRGAPAIGVAAAFGVLLGVQKFKDQDKLKFLKLFHETCDYLASSRPTAVNLFNMLNMMRNVVARNPQAGVAVLKKLLFKEAMVIFKTDQEVCRRMGDHGAKLIKNGMQCLTVCNAGALATVDYGTALGVFYSAKKQNKKFSVFSCETRPLLQGARLTCWELLRQKIDTTLICDNMAASLMGKGKVDIIFTGADRIASNGDTANKIGTYMLAVLAKHHGIPFYIVAPSTTFDLAIKSGKQIPIEERNSEEVTHFAGVPTAPKGIKVYNPAFDVTPARLIKGIVTEYGIIHSPYVKNIYENIPAR